MIDPIKFVTPISTVPSLGLTPWPESSWIFWRILLEYQIIELIPVSYSNMPNSIQNHVAFQKFYPTSALHIDILLDDGFYPVYLI